VLRDCYVVSVVPAPDSTHLLVTVKASQEEAVVLEALHRATGLFRNEIASAIHRKKVPQLRFACG
jgi:ribosome-binding factor A